MNQNEKPKFFAMLSDVMSYYKQDTSEFMMNLFWDACKGFEFTQISKAMNAHAKDAERGVYAPKVADIVRSLQGTTTDRAAIAWGKVLGAMGSVGAYTDVVFDDSAIHAAIVDCGGWTKMCRSDMKDLSYLQHRFCQSHKTYTDRQVFEYPRRLTGDRSHDDEYLKRGIPLPRPAIVGDHEKAKRVMDEGGEGGPKIAFNLSLHAIGMSESK